MKKIIIIFTLICFMFLVSCSTPQKIDTFNPETEVTEKINFDSLEILEERLLLTYTFSVDDDILLQDFTVLSSVEVNYLNEGFGFGEGFGSEFTYGIEYSLFLDGSSVNDVSLMNIRDDSEHTLIYIIYLSELDSSIDYEKIIDVRLIIEFGSGIYLFTNIDD